MNDGVYGSFNCIIFDHALPLPCPLRVNGQFVLGKSGDFPTFESSIWGPTCDSMDCISKEAKLPELQVGDWILFEDMGAYTSSAASKL